MADPQKPDRGFIDASTFRGLNNLSRETATTANTMREAVDVDLDRDGKVRTRQGYGEPLAPCAMGHSLWSDPLLSYGLYADGEELRAFWPNGDTELVATGLAAGRPVSYTLVGDWVYWSNGVQSGVVQGATAAGGEWASDQPSGQPDIAPIATGSFTAGTVQVAVTFLDALGRESGTSVAAVADIPAGGVQILNIPQPARADTGIIRLYATTPDGTVLQHVTDLPAGISSYTMLNPPTGRACATQFLEPMPAGDLLASGNGRLFAAVDGVLIWSEPMRYGLSRIGFNHLRLPARITMMVYVGAGTEGAGLLVAAGQRTYWLGGPDPGAWRQVLAAAHGAVPGTLVHCPGSAWGMETRGLVPVWLSDTGHFVAGLPGGQVVSVNGDGYVAHGADAGASMFREVDGIPQLVSSLRGPFAQQSAVGDIVAVRVFRYDGEQPAGEQWDEPPPADRETW